ncbi:hypothetical protein PX554_05355 [Sphingomonas sp. H39-1-10]|nr:MULTISPECIES: hypothetical protein [Sphingomonas]MDF0487547.1 hypothetical protein [Sphingomonas pollutisoli]SDA16538.1 hypothetical protein SAMN03159340_00932 [Sphingomonas sp. NFR15]
MSQQFDDEGPIPPGEEIGRTPGPIAFFVGLTLLGMVMALVALLKQRF